MHRILFSFFLFIIFTSCSDKNGQIGQEQESDSVEVDYYAEEVSEQSVMLEGRMKKKMLKGQMKLRESK